jgi:hypothetical protein
VSIFDHPDLVAAAPSWRCPHCRTLQPEAVRCRACARSAVSCASCHRFRRSIASDLGYCADDAARSPLSGEEVRSCWEGAPSTATAPGLFDAAELAAKPATAPPSGPARPLGDPAPASPRPPVAGGLVDAPHVPPSGRLTSELERRARSAGD